MSTDLSLKPSTNPNRNDETKSDHEEEISNREGEVVEEKADTGIALHTYEQHLKDVMAISIPIVLSEVFQNALPVVDIAFVGNLPSKDDLAAAALATVWFNLWNSTMMGFTSAIDTFLAQTYGASQLKAYGVWTGTGLGIVMIVTVLEAVIISLCGPVMKLFGQDEILAERAGDFSLALIPGLFPYNAFKVFIKYLQAQNKVLPGVWIGILANAFNCLFNWLLIYQLDGGLNGAPWATTLTRLVEFLMLGGYILCNKKSPEFEATWPTFPRSMWTYEMLSPFCRLAISGALSMTADAWSFEATTILAGLIGTVELDAHIVTLTVGTFLYLSFSFAVGIAASIRVGQWMGEGSPVDAQRSSKVSYLLSGAVQLMLIAILWPCSHLVGKWFSSDDEVASLVAELIPICCIFMFGDTVQATSGGILRGLGKQSLVLSLNILAYWVLAIPMGSLLTFVGNASVKGLWWGFVIGIYAATIAGLIYLRFFLSWEKESEVTVKRISTLGTVCQEPRSDREREVTAIRDPEEPDLSASEQR